MSANIITPSVIAGPAYIATGGVVVYVERDIQVEDVAESWTPKTTFGDAGERHKSRMFRLTFKPVGMLTGALLDWFYEAHMAPASYVGQSIFPASNYAVTIYSVAEDKTYGYVQGGIEAPPDMTCTPTETLFGSMKLVCVGAKGVSPTSANFIKQTGGTIGSLDTSFDFSKIKTDIYNGVLGSLSSPYNSLGAMAGWQLKFGYKTKVIPSSDVGIADIHLDSDGFNLKATFAPSNLTEAQVDTLLGLQGTAAVLPGQPYGTATNSGNLVLTGQVFGWVFTANQLGAKSAKRVYSIGEHRFPNGAIEMTNAMAQTTGVPNALFSFTAGS